MKPPEKRKGTVANITEQKLAKFGLLTKEQSKEEKARVQEQITQQLKEKMWKPPEMVYKNTSFIEEYYGDKAAQIDMKEMDLTYQETNPQWEKNDTTMPSAVALTFQLENSGIKLPQETILKLQDCFDKFSSIGNPILQPVDLREKFETLGYAQTEPGMYNMICWITEANEYSGTDGVTFDEFMQMAGYFFS